jgi:DnaJ-class molecular chaperone
MNYLFRPGFKKRMPGQGMPLMTDPDKYGDMIIEFDVEYPNGLNTDQKLYIKEALINNQNNKKQHQHQQQNQNRKKAVTNDE